MQIKTYSPLKTFALYISTFISLITQPFKTYRLAALTIPARSRSYVSIFLSLALMVTMLSLSSVITATPVNANTLCTSQNVSGTLQYTATLVNSNTECVVRFTSGTGTWTKPSFVTLVDYLIVGGGGAGGVWGSGHGGGGGGGGGVLRNSTAYNVESISSTTITVGTGGSAAILDASSNVTTAPMSGGDSVAFNLTAKGGGRGGYPGQDGGAPGGSGGGGRNGMGGAGTNTQGFEGGAGSFPLGGGGGGATSAGGAGNSAGRYETQGGGHGVGITSTISGTFNYYGYGGSGGSDTSGGSYWTERAGSGDGGPGGGDNVYSQYHPGRAGMSGTVIIRFAVPQVTTPTITSQPSVGRVTSAGSTTFSVTASAGASTNLSYQWQESTDDGSNWTYVGTNSSTYTKTSITSSMSNYKYRVIVTNTENEVTASTTSEETTLFTQPGQITDLEAIPGEKQISLAWTAPSDGGSALTNYVIERTTDNFAGGAIESVEIAATSPSYVVTGLTNGQKYYFRVSAKNAIGTGTASTVANTTPYSEVDYSLNFDGVDDHLKLTGAQVIDDTGEYTIEAWVYQDPTTVNIDTIVYHGSAVESRTYIATVKTSSTNYIKIGLDGDFDKTTSVSMPLNEWAHVALTRTATAYTLYLNGTAIDSGSKNRSSFSNDVYVGRSGAGDHFKGKIDQVKFYNTALSAAEVATSMHTWGAVSGKTLTAHLDFNDASTSTVSDKTTNNKNFTVNGSIADTAYVDVKTESLDKKVITFTRSYLTASGGWKVPADFKSFKYLVVGGGGGGGNGYDSWPGGGGGAGGLLTGSLIKELGSLLEIKVGVGGLGGAAVRRNSIDTALVLPRDPQGQNGQASAIGAGAVTANGGGGGGSSRANGSNGASGGGAGSRNDANWLGGTAISGQGFAGGVNISGGGAGGGGGAGSAGLKPCCRVGGAGGAGTKSLLTGVEIEYAIGGQGGSWNADANGASGLANRGNGGGGGSSPDGVSTARAGGAGGSGIVILQYETPPVAGQVTGLTATAGDKQVLLTWTAPAGTVTDYKIEKSTTETGGWEIVEDGVSTSTSYAVTGLTNRTKYYFRVSAQVSGVATFGTPSNIASATPSTSDTALETTGTQYASNTGRVIQESDNFTIEAWIKPASNIQSYARFISQGTNTNTHFRLERNNNGQLFWKYGFYQDVTGFLPLDTWTHVAFTRSSTSGVRVFLNGEQTYSCTGCTNTYDVGTTFMVGSDASDPTNSIHLWKGSLDEVRVYNTAKVQADIETDINSYGPVNNANLLAYYDFNNITAELTSKVPNKATSDAAKLLNVDLTVTGSSASATNAIVENIAQTGTYLSSQTITFPRSYLTSDGGYPVPDGVTNVKALVVGGGGGGGWGYHGGGGGAGEVIETNSAKAVQPGDLLAVTVGTPGAGTNFYFSSGTKGTNSALKFLRLNEQFVANGGGAGGGGNGPVTGTSGGSGGGGSSGAIGGLAVKNTYDGWSTYANAGGPGAGAEGGGGGGAGGAGSNTSSGDNGGPGGVGIRSTITGSFYGGGGGGAWGAPGGTGGGGKGGNPGTKGTNGTGGGGGSAAFGGSGVVVVSYSYAPSDPTNLIASATSASAINLTWTAPSSTAPTVTGYVIEQSTDGINWGAIGTTASGTTTFAVTELNSSTLYFFRVAAKAGESQSGYISTSATTKPQPLPAGAVCNNTSTQNGLTVAAGHGKVFYIDTGQGQSIDAGYVAYGVTSATARNDLWVELSGFTGGVLSLADPSTSALPLGSIATAGGTGTSFFMLKASGATLLAQSHVLRVYTSKPSIGNPAPIYECTFSFTRVEETIKAAANKVESIVSTSVSSIGSTMTITVEGDSGTIGQGNDLDGRMFWLIPAARSSWPVNAVRLEKTELRMYSDSGRTTLLGDPFVNTLRINNSNGLNAATRQYWRAVYTFRAVGIAASTAPIIPIAMISSGTQIKHTDVASLPSSGSTTLDLTNPTVSLAVNKNASTTSEVRSDGTTRFNYTISLYNSGGSELILDEVVDSPDAKLAYVSGTAKFGATLDTATAINDPGKLGTSNSISFSGPITIPAGQTRNIYYSMAAETCKVGQSYTLQNTATARSGVVVIGSGSATQSVVTVNGNCGESTVAVTESDDPIPPNVITQPASSITQTTATINGSVDPNTVAGRSVRFNFSTSSNLSNPTAYSLSNTTSSDIAYTVNKPLTGLTANTTYYYRIEVFVDGAWKLGEILSFTTEANPTVPIPKTNLVTDISSDGKAKFNGTLDANFVTGGVKGIYEYKAVTTGANCSTVTSPTATGFLQDESGTPLSDALVTGSGPAPLSYSISGLTANTEYCVRIVGIYGISSRVNGDWVKFTSTAKAPQVIGFSTLPNVLPAGGTTIVTATNTGAASTNPIIYTSVDPSICTVNPTTGAVTAVANSGTCVITATQDGNDAYYPAEPQTISFAISPPEITTKTLPNGTYGSSYSQSINAIGGTGTYTTWTLQPGSELPPGLNFNSSTGVITGTPTIAGIYVIYVVTTDSNGIKSAPQPITITINKVVVPVTASSHSVVYLSEPPTVSPSYDATVLISPDTTSVFRTGGNISPTCTSTYTSTTNAGVSGVKSSCSGGWASNYTFTFIEGVITITPYPVTITADNKTKASGAVDPTFTYTTSTLPTGKSLTDVLTANPTLSRTNANTNSNGVITPTGTANSNYTVTFETGTLTVSAKIIPTITMSNITITYGDLLTGKLNAEAKDGATVIDGTFAYTYVDSNSQTITLTQTSELDAGTYSAKVRFTPIETLAATYESGIEASFTITVNPFALIITAVDKSKLNKVSDSKTLVSSDPSLSHTVDKPTLPFGRTLDDVLIGGLKINRANSGTPAGTYLTASLPAGEQKTTTSPLAITPSGTVNRNYAVTFVNGNLTINEKILPKILTTDSEKTTPEIVGDRLNANAKHLTDLVDGVFEYRHEITNAIITSNTALPSGEHNIIVKFTPTDSSTYEGPIYGEMLIRVLQGAVVNPPNNPGPGNPAINNPTPEPTNTSNSRGNRPTTPPQIIPPNNNPQNPLPIPTNTSNPQAQGPTVNPGQTRPLPAVVIPALPGINRLLTPQSSNDSQIQGLSGTPSERTVDFGSGIKTVEEVIQEGGISSNEEAKRSINQVQNEKLGGFSPPGAGTRIEVIGARTGARFVVSNQSQIDTFTLMEAINRSIPTQAQDFTRITSINENIFPSVPSQWSEEERNYAAEIFAASGLSAPVNLRDLYLDQFNSWIRINTQAETYLPGSIVYLTVTSDPLVIGSAVVDKDGFVQVSGDMPVEWLQTGEHRIRLVGIRSLDGVTVDEQGEVQLSEELIQEIEKFDLGTQATITVIGPNASGGEHAALRVVPLVPTAPWWTMLFVLITGLIALYLRRKNYLNTNRRRYLALGAIGLASLPAVIIGWFSTVTIVVWVGIAATLASLAANWFIPVEEKEEQDQSI